MSEIIVALAAFIVALLAYLHSLRESARAIDVTMRQLRAYVLVDNVTLGAVEPGAPIQFQVTFKNCGQTPATSMRMVNAVFIADKSISPAVFEDEGDIEEFAHSDSPLGPNQVQTMLPRSPFNVDAELLKRILAREEIIYLAVRIEYRDAFNIRRTTKMLSLVSFLGVPPSCLTLVAPCEAGNFIT